MENRLAYLEARVSILEHFVLHNAEMLKNYLNVMNRMRDTFDKESTSELKELFEAHFLQLSQTLEQMDKE